LSSVATHSKAIDDSTKRAEALMNVKSKKWLN
jgi:hypothetical protein